MTIQRGKDWGEEIANPVVSFGGMWTCGSEHDLCGDRPLTSDVYFALTKGDLYDFLGSPPSAEHTERCRRLSVDAIRVALTRRDGTTSSIVGSSVVVRRGWMRGGLFFGDVLVASNCARFRGVSFSDRCHPNDGKVEILVAHDSSFRERMLAWSRMRSQTFAPTEQVRVLTVKEMEHDIARDSLVIVDGKAYRGVQHVSINILPDYQFLHIGVI